VHSLRLLDALMAQPQQSLPASSLLGVCCTCLSTIFSTSADRTAATSTTGSESDLAVVNTALSCFRNAVRCYPTVVMQRCFGAVQSIVSMLASAMAEHTSSDAIQDATAVADVSAKKKTAHSVVTKMSTTQKLATSLDICDLMSTAEMLLLMGAPLLDVDTRQSIEHSVALGLHCVCKGVMFSDSYRMSSTAATDTLLSLATMHGSGSSSSTTRPQKRMKRATCEPLRTNMTALNTLLRFGVSEVSAPYPDGSRSGNLAMLKSAAGACFGVDALSVEATRVCRYIEAVIFPIASNIPGIPVGAAALDSYPLESSSIAYAEKCISDHLNAATEIPSQKSGQVAVSTGEALATNASRASATVTSLRGAALFGKGSVSAVSDDAMIEAVAESSMAMREDSNKTRGDIAVKKRLFSASLGADEEANVTAADPNSEDESDDDDLPDLDVDADPDQM
jgi:hypothetical protein